MNETDTPETEALEDDLYNRWPSEYECDEARLQLCRKLERQRNAYAKIIREFMELADNFAERRRGYLNFLRLADGIEEDFPEFATGKHSPTDEE